MSLDLVVGACAKPGHEDEWRQILERDFCKELTDADLARFEEISIAPYLRIEAPRVGFDEAANAWIIEVKQATTPEQAAEVIKAFHGYRALWLVECDGISRYSSSRVSNAVDETSFCGAFLDDCPDVLETGLLKTASRDMWPAEAVAYGEALLAAAERAEGRTAPIAIIRRAVAARQSRPEQNQVVRYYARTAARHRPSRGALVCVLGRARSLHPRPVLTAQVTLSTAAS